LDVCKREVEVIESRVCRSNTRAREESQVEKDKIRTEIKRALKHDGNIDFVVETGGKVRVFEDLQTKEAGNRSTDLSGMFR
jgi:hypothetical protein